MHRILVFGLPGAGKTWLATRLHELVPSLWLNADDIRKKFDDWDFSPEGRTRQATRMRQLADDASEPFAIADFVCPTPELRSIYAAHTSIWIDTIEKGRFEDTNKMFVKPENCSKIVDHHYSEDEVLALANWIKTRQIDGEKDV